MRLRELNHVLVFNERDGEWKALVRSLNRKAGVLYVEALQRLPEVLPFLGLGIALLKPDKWMLVLEKATELGVTDIYPLITEQIAVRQWNKERSQRRVIEAVEQCERCTVPVIHPCTSFKIFLEKLVSPWGAAIERMVNDGAYSLGHLQGVIVGPEGGFSQQEKTCLRSHPYITSISLGAFILRSETAVFASLSFLSISRNN